MQYRMARLGNPKEIISFLQNVFEIYEIRQRVGDSKGVVFHVRTNEGNHVLPHIHAAYGEYNISIEIATGRILEGNLPRKKEKIATTWVVDHKEKLLTDWKNIAISAISTMTKSGLDFAE